MGSVTSIPMSDSSLIAHYAPKAFRREWDFLIQCVALQLSGEADAPPPMPDPEGLNWNTILRLAEANRVVPLLAAAVLANGAKNVAPEAAADLKGRLHYYKHRGMFFVMELREVLASLRRAGIRCIPLKGPVLTAASYGKLGRRDFDDLDLLVAPADVTRAVTMLATLGYVGWDIPERWLATHLNTESEHNLICKDRGVTLDLHWAIGRKYFTMPLDFEELWSRTVRTRLIGSEVPDLSPEDTVLFLCYHGGKHLFGRLTWVCDVAATIGAHPNLDWDAVLTRATQMGARRLLLLGLCLAQNLLGSELPLRMTQLIRLESSLESLASRVLRGIFREANSTSPLKQQIEASLFHLQVRERISDRLRYLVWGAEPNARDWHDSRLPQSLSFLLLLSRPIRLLRKNWTRAAA
jgi:hypothetical protein